MKGSIWVPYEGVSQVAFDEAFSRWWGSLQYTQIAPASDKFGNSSLELPCSRTYVTMIPYGVWEYFFMKSTQTQSVGGLQLQTCGWGMLSFWPPPASPPRMPLRNSVDIRIVLWEMGASHNLLTKLRGPVDAIGPRMAHP
jgi:hypothetical protein